MAFSYEINSNESDTILVMTGALDENAKLPVESFSGDVRVSLEHVSYINSVGVRSWIKWLQEVSRQARILLHGCPVLFVKNLGTIRGMKTKSTVIESFYVPYYDDKYNERKNVLFSRGREFMDDGTLNMPKVTNANGEVIEPDVIESAYFSFLKL